MAFRFGKSIRFAPGVRLNLGKKSASVSVGGRGLRYTTGTRGDHVTVSIPGSGLSYVKKVRSRSVPVLPLIGKIALMSFGGVILLMIVAGLFAG